MAAEWWRTAAVYQIYPRSFADSGGDGIGDLPGITSRISYLEQLGVDAVWLSPFYPSALADGGYDVDDYRDIDPRLGTLEDFDAMITGLHDAGLKVIVDIVPNHSSNRHPWFVDALAAGSSSPERERYIFRNGTGPDGSEPPNDWQSLFGGSAWEPVGDGQFYFHCFAPEQPDLNWENEEVRADFRTTMRFWSDRGVDGFRIDVAHGLRKDMSEPYLPWGEIAEMKRSDGSHPLWDRDDVQEIYAEWRTIFDEYAPPRFAVAEASVHPTRRARYASPASLGQAFNFAMQDANFSTVDYREVIDSGLADMINSGSTTTWLLGCHDTPRVATRYGLPLTKGEAAQKVSRAWLLTDGRSPALDRDRGVRRARAAILILLALPGSTYIYQGDELGLHEVGDLSPEVLEDPMASRSTVEKGRDGCRVPLPWTAYGPSYGFGPGPARPPQPGWFAAVAVDVQDRDPESTLNLYRQALAQRRDNLADDDFSWVDTDQTVLAFDRGAIRCISNFGEHPVRLPPGEVLLSSSPVTDGELPAEAAAWVRVEAAALS